MKQKLLCCVFLTFIILMSLLPNLTLAVVKTSDYNIQKYEINMIVNEDNTFDITENITAYFNVPKHGIFRKIPLRNSVDRTDGTESNNIAKITNINVNEKYTTSSEDGYKVIKIGNSQNVVTGRHNYTIKYKYNLGKDPLKDADELYFNLIGDQWDTKIDNISFTIQMPKEFDESLLGFSSGSTGTANSSNVTYNVNGNIITGNVNNTLEAGQGVTVRLALPEDYFVEESFNFDTYSVCTIIVCAMFVLIAFILWEKFGKDDKAIETVEFYPPEGYNSAEVGFMYKGKANDKSIISLLVYLADKGYLKIEETEEKGVFTTSKGFKITKVREYDGTNKYEKMFFDGLFKNYRDSVTNSDLYNDFYVTLNKIKTKMNSKENKEKIFKKSASSKIIFLILMVLVLYLIITIKPVIEYDSELLIFALLFPRNWLYGSYIYTFK